MIARCALAVLVAWSGGVGVRQPAAVHQRTGALGGRVISDDVDAKPIRNAIVTLAGAALGPDIITVTDEIGRFTFGDLPGGHFTISATKPAYLPVYYGSRRVGRGPGVPIAIAEGQAIGDLTLRMARGAVVTGTIRDAYGHPRAAQVSLLEARTVNGERSLVSVKTGNADTSGEYRIFGLMPGTYLVASYATTSDGEAYRTLSTVDVDAALRDAGSATQPVARPSQTRLPGAPVAYAPTMYPGTTDVNAATPIVVAAGEERTGIDVTLTRVPTATLTGTVLDTDGRPPRGIRLSKISIVESLGLRGGLLSGSVVSVSADGSFSLLALAPGSYTFFARAMAPAPSGSSPATGNALTLWAKGDVTMSGQDVSGFSLVMQPGLTVAGRMTMDGSAPAIDPARLRITLTPAHTEGPNIAVPPVMANADGSFAIHGVPPGEFYLDVAPPASSPWSLRSAVSAGHDLLDAPLVVAGGQDPAEIAVTLSDRHTTLSGHLTDPLGHPAPEYQVVVFSVDRSMWRPQARRIRAVHPATDGSFAVAGLPPGSYFVGAVTNADPADFADTSLLDMMAAIATRITLGDNETRTLDLQIGVTEPLNLGPARYRLGGLVVRK